MFEQIKNQFVAFVQDEEGASMVEYVLLVAVIAVALIAGFKIVRDNSNKTLVDAGSQLGGKLSTPGQ